MCRSVNCKVIVAIFIHFLLNHANAGFYHGMTVPGSFEYSNINGWMKPREAADLCERDTQCGGFTFHGTLTHEVEFEVFFFHFVETIFLDREDFQGWDWTTYKVNR